MFRLIVPWFTSCPAAFSNTPVPETISITSSTRQRCGSLPAGAQAARSSVANVPAGDTKSCRRVMCGALWPEVPEGDIEVITDPKMPSIPAIVTGTGTAPGAQR